VAATADGVYELETLSDSSLSRLIGSGATTIVVPFGSIERHGAHLPLGADALLADTVGREVARRLHAVLAPTVRTGYAEQHGPILSVHSDTLTDVAFQIAEGLAKQGFRVIALVSTHGGNRMPLRAAVELVNNTHPDIACCAPEGDVGREPGSYSGEWLTSVLLALRPHLVDIQAADGKLAAELRDASAERGRVHFERFVSAIVDGVTDAGRASTTRSGATRR
jgi:creatinine amidohydrolase/Fe(II)-dependent formamide hydrolase-like protein